MHSTDANPADAWLKMGRSKGTVPRGHVLHSTASMVFFLSCQRAPDTFTKEDNPQVVLEDKVTPPPGSFTQYAEALNLGLGS